MAKRGKTNRPNWRMVRTKKKLSFLFTVPLASLDEGESHENATSVQGVSGEEVQIVEGDHKCEETCRHFERGANLQEFLSWFAKLKDSSVQCEDCVKGRKSGVSKKKRKGTSSKEKSTKAPSSQKPGDATTRWVCLTCGYLGCGSICSTLFSHLDYKGENEIDRFKDRPRIRGHARKHWRVTKHPLALQCGKRPICWCFQCEADVSFVLEDLMSSEPHNDEDHALQQAAKFVRKKVMSESGNVQDFERVDAANLTNHAINQTIKGESNLSLSDQLHYKPIGKKRLVSGLINLGNTCFFNSVTQNLLALNCLRDYLCQDFRVVEGPQTTSLRELFLETNAGEPDLIFKNFGQMDMRDSGAEKAGKGRVFCESSIGSTLNPSSLFSAVCAKAPRFRGFQQQDSHELLRCLLDGLQTEELSTRIAHGESANVEGFDSTQDGHETLKAYKQIDGPQMGTLVDRYFGGQLSSTVTCCQCGYSSVVYEQFLDLSLQIPAKGSPQKSTSWTPPCFVENVHKDSLAREVKTRRFTEISGTLEKVQSSKQLTTACISFQHGESEAREVLKVGSDKHDDLNHFKRMDHLVGGIQSAEVSRQGLANNSGCQQEPNGFVHSGVDPESSSISKICPISCLPINKVESSGSTLVSDCNVSDSFGKGETVGTLGDYSTECSWRGSHKETIISATEMSQDTISVGEKEMTIEVQCGQTDKTRSLASTCEVLFLSGEKQSAFAKCSSELSIEKDSYAFSSTVFNQDEDGFDGFSQLFEGSDENIYFQTKKSAGCDDIHQFQMLDESSVDAAWEAGTEDYYAEFNNVCAMGPVKEVLPMLLEGCLADFTKSELLCGENAWACERCSKRSGVIQKEHALKVLEQCLRGCIAPAEQGESQLGKEESQEDCREVVRLDGSDVSCSTCSSNGDIFHPTFMNGWNNFSNCEIVTPFEKGNISETLSQVHTRSLIPCKVGCNGSSESYLAARHRSLDMGAMEVAFRFRNGSARLNELDRGQHSVRLASCRKNEAKGRNCLDKFTCSRNSGGISVRISGCVAEEREGIYLQSQYDKGENSKTCYQVEKMDSILSAQSLSNWQGQGDNPASGNFNYEASTSIAENEFPSLCRIPGKTMELQKGKNKEVEQVSVEVVNQDAIKRLLISKAPRILTIHLKRFAQDVCGRISKLSGHVAFQEWLDVRPFLDCRCVGKENSIYRLNGIVEHTGTIRCGHYVAYVRGPAISDNKSEETERGDLTCESSWYYISDSHVQKSTLEAVLSSEAYLLFYEKCIAS